MSGFGSSIMTELASLSSEARRKYPEIKEASERVILLIRSSKNKPPADLALELAHSADTILPFTLACTTKQVKLITIAMGCMQRLTTHSAIPADSIATILTTLNDVVSLGVEIQLRILQLLMPLLSNYESVHGPVLAQALKLCFKLQESKVGVVNNTAAATLRQLVILVFEKVGREDEALPPTLTVSQSESPDPGLSSSARDALAVFQDLCLLTGGLSPQFIDIVGLARTFGLELMESVLTYHSSVFRRHRPFAALLRDHMCPVVIKLFSDSSDFPSYMRLMRLFFISIKQLRTLIPVECEIYITMLIRLLDPDYPMWQRVLAMEVFRGMCGDGELLRFLYSEYDLRERAKPVYADFIAALGRIATEKPNSIGIANGSAATPQPTGTALTTAAEAPGGNGPEGSDSVDPSVLSRSLALVRVQCLDQLDKVEPPPIPDSYLFYLSMMCLTGVVDKLAATTLPLVTQSLPLAASGASPVPEPLSDPTVPVLTRGLNLDQHAHGALLRTVRGMTDAAWPALLAAFSFYLTTRLDDELFRQLMTAYQHLTNLSGALGLGTPRDALLTSLCKHCLP
ncbi:guanine nucleotide exchange factor in Golgi transport N-terminal-domain-containing protein, partial [Dimargaris cristalligena]